MAAEPEPNDPRPNGGSRPIPDPTVLTTQFFEKAIAAEHALVEAELEVLRERLHGIDKATDLRLGSIAELPGRVDEKIRCADDVVVEKFGSVNRLIDERFASVGKQFDERDTRADAITQLNKTALDAAFAAQKEAAAEQNKSNTLAISKSETATSETIAKLAELFRTTTDGLADKIDDLKSRVGVTEASMVGLISTKSGGTEAVTNQRQTIAFAFTAVLFIITVVGFVIALQAKP